VANTKYSEHAKSTNLQYKKKYPNYISNCRSFEGNVTVFLKTSSSLARTRSEDKRIVINTRNGLEDFLRNELSTTIEAVCNRDPFADNRM